MQPDQWTALYGEHMGPLYSAVSRRVGGDRALAEDLVQEAWLAALDRWKAPPADARAWLLTCAMNRLRNHLRRRQAKPLAAVEGAVRIDALASESTSDDPDRALLLQCGLARLRPEQAELIEEHHLDGQSLADMATARGTSSRAIEGRLARARRALARALKTLPTTTPRSTS